VSELMSDPREIAATPPESAAPWALTKDLSASAAERVGAWWERAHRVYPETTQRAWRFDWAVFLGFCEPQSASPLPASPETVAAFVEAFRAEGKKPATIHACDLSEFNRSASQTRLDPNDEFHGNLHDCGHRSFPEPPPQMLPAAVRAPNIEPVPDTVSTFYANLPCWPRCADASGLGRATRTTDDGYRSVASWYCRSSRSRTTRRTVRRNRRSF